MPTGISEETKVKGKLFIELPNYRQLYEAHYKLPLPMFLPIWINKIILRLLRRPVDFLGTINKKNTSQLRKIYQKFPEITPMLITPDVIKMPKTSFSIVFLIQSIQFLIFKFFDHTANQTWILHKSNNTSQ